MSFYFLVFTLVFERVQYLMSHDGYVSFKICEFNLLLKPNFLTSIHISRQEALF